MIVWNEFRNDARVLKQARTLQAAGYQVTVFALHTPGVTHRNEVLAEGIRVIRVARSPGWRPARAGARAGACASTAPASQSMPLRRSLSRLWVHAGLLARIVLHRAAVVHAHDVNTLPPPGWPPGSAAPGWSTTPMKSVRAARAMGAFANGWPVSKQP